jgi:hypothetical protein
VPNRRHALLIEKAARRRLYNSNLMILDLATINAGFDFRRYSTKRGNPKPAFDNRAWYGRAAMTVPQITEASSSRTTGPVVALVGKWIAGIVAARRFSDVRATSALPPKADIHHEVRHVRFVPKPEVEIV